MQKQTQLIDILYPFQRGFATNPKKRKIWISSRQIGKSFTIAFNAVYSALKYGNQGLSLVISVNLRSASEIINKCEQFAQAVEILSNKQITYTKGFDHVKFSNGARVISLPATNPAALRGFSSQLVCLDEAAFIPHLDEVMAAISPTLTRNPNSELLLTTTPAGTNGFFYKIYQDALTNPEWYVQHTTINDAINDGLKVVLNSLKSLCPDPDVFAQEYECRFSKEYSQFIDLELLDFTDKIPTGIHFAGVDVGSTSDRTAICDLIQAHDHIYVNDIKMLHKATFNEQIAQIQNIHSRVLFKKGYIDQNGIGAALPEFIQKAMGNKIFIGYSTTAANKTTNYEYLRAKIFDRKIHFAKHLEALIKSDFQNIQRLVNDSGKISYIADRNENGHSDATSSIVLALQAEHDNPQNAAMPVSYHNISAFGSYRSRI